MTSVDASAYAVESDNPFDSLDDHEKSVIPNTFQNKIASKIFWMHAIMSSQAISIHCYAIRTGKSLNCFILNHSPLCSFSMAKTYAENRKIAYNPNSTIPSRFFRLFSIMPVAQKHLALIFRTPYTYTYKVKSLIRLQTPSMPTIATDTAMKLKSTRMAKQLHRVQFVAPIVKMGWVWP